MQLFRRLFGTQSTEKHTEKRTEKQKTTDTPQGPALEISPPGAEVNIVPPAPFIQTAPTVGPAAAAAVSFMPATMPATMPASVPVATPSAGLYGATRQLPPPETYVGKPGQYLTYGFSSDIGMVRTNNQDALYHMFCAGISADGLPDFGLFVVADGMGGHHDGERASAVATRVIANYITSQFYMKILDRSMDETDNPTISDVLSNAVQMANEAVSEQIPEGGTTVTAAVIVGDIAHIAHVGDSRAYLITGDGIEQITRDHSLVQRLIELDQLTPEEASVHPQRNVLYRAIGQSEHVDIDTVTRRLPPGARLLLCSDGLWNNIPDDKLLQVVTLSAAPQEACDRLVGLANDRGGADNITVIIVQVPG